MTENGDQMNKTKLNYLLSLKAKRNKIAFKNMFTTKLSFTNFLKESTK